MDPGTGVLFPSKLGELRLQNVEEYEETRLGRTLGYSAKGLTASIYTYNRGLPEIPEGVDSPAIRDEFDESKGHVYEIEDRGEIEHLGDRVVIVEHGSNSIAMRFAKFRFKQQGATLLSYLHLFAKHGNFVKIRVTCDLVEAKCDARSDALVKNVVKRFHHKSRERIPREMFLELVEELISEPYGEHADGLRSILYVYVDGIRPEFVLCIPQFAPLLDSDVEDHDKLWIQIAISSGSYLVKHPEAIDDQHSYQVGGIEGALRMYENMLTTNSAVQHAFLDGLIALRKEGRLIEHVQNNSCDE